MTSVLVVDGKCIRDVAGWIETQLSERPFEDRLNFLTDVMDAARDAAKEIGGALPEEDDSVLDRIRSIEWEAQSLEHEIMSLRCDLEAKNKGTKK